MSFQDSLRTLYNEEEVRSIFRILCEDLLHFSSTDFLLMAKDELNNMQVQILEKSLTALTTGKPVQHITGLAHFHGMQFQVDEYVLIPRQETEELVQLIIDNHQDNPPNSILDIGTGSGCVSISLGSAFAKAELTATDISSNALQVATVNADLLLPDQRINFKNQDILQIEEIDFFDVVVSNPPYVREMEKVELHQNVLEHDPATALFVKNDDPLVFYRHILKLCKRHSATTVYFEINQYLKIEMEKLATALGFKCEIYRDLNNNWRMMRCWQ